jgi:hypothetical protein
MAQLGGKSIRTTIQSLEVLSDDGKQVLMFDTLESGVKIRVRAAHESPWGSHPTWMVSKSDAEILAKIVGGHDAQYNLSALTAITSSDFTADDVTGAAIDAAVEARCSQLDIERAKAANIAEEKDLLVKTLVVQHLDDKHMTASITGCELCEEADRQARNPFTDEALDEPFDEFANA